MRRYYPSIQILRGVLFLLILAFHCNVPYVNFGWGGWNPSLLSVRFSLSGNNGEMMDWM